MIRIFYTLIVAVLIVLTILVTGIIIFLSLNTP